MDEQSEETTTLAAKLNRGRMQLLDLSTRNRLINVPRRSKTINVLEVFDQLTSEIFRLLVTDGKGLSFVPGRKAPGEAEQESDAEEITALAQPEDDPVDERGIAHRHSDTKLQTRLTSEGLQKRLLTLHLDAKTLQEEQGVNILYLALGMLKWFESDTSDIERHAPLILLPVSLERGTVAERFKLKWLQEDPSSNLSLSALMKRQFGIDLPEFVDGEEESFDPVVYLDRVATAVSGQPKWQVLKDDMVLGFFSFAKFLMYRDLDPTNWPNGFGLSDHPIVAGLLGDGFPGADPLFGEDDPIDPHIGPEDLIHIVDADSSQTAAIHEVRQARNLVIQGPPGTGKSQTIANVIASAVHDGRKVLFVAEKMAALEVVKRRLDHNGVGDVCLELHSNKTNKRAVLEELRKTWDRGRPNGASDAALIRQLGQYRDLLNEHAARLHRRHEASGMTPYKTIGHLVRLRKAGHRPATTALVAPETWSRHEKEERELQLQELAERVDIMGLPSQHPWRGVRLSAILPTDLQRLLTRIQDLRSRLTTLLTSFDSLSSHLQVPKVCSFLGVDWLAGIGRRISLAPELSAEALRSAAWRSQTINIADLVTCRERLTAARTELQPMLADVAWDTDMRGARQVIAVSGNGWFRWLKRDYRDAIALMRSIWVGELPKSTSDRVRALDRLIEGRKAAAELAQSEKLGREAFGDAWRRDRSDWKALRKAVQWMQGNGDGPAADQIREIASMVTDRIKAGILADAIVGTALPLETDFTALFRAFDLDLSAAFNSGNLRDIDLDVLGGRLDLWIDRHEELSKWTAYLARAEDARSAGLGEFVDAMSSGALAIGSVLPEFEMAYYEALFADMVRANPELAAFDGDGHSRAVQEFISLDQKRMDLARREVVAAHFARIPRIDGGAGPLGVLKGEIARKRGHMPIRRLMKRAGPAIQALKPVLMMSPLSVAQFLEPGAVEFDILVVDEASQIQPVDALGAIARCKQIVVVGDDRQLPPTRFFAKVISGEDERDDDDVAGVADIESILGLCVSKGLPQRMLRWHYRSRHQSLIAVSNREFYENRLYIVPSPYTAQAGMGLGFVHVPGGTFDSGNTAINAEEARVVAEAVIRHAKENPKQSLGVVAFSTKQRRAIVDELERLRRMHPETEPFFSIAHPSEPYFTKNLENVQGDERDVVFISVGYGRNPQGYMAMRFGPLSLEGGERRLNVLISRAKRRCTVFASITDEDIDLERGRSKGVEAFKLFLNFARTGKLGIGVSTDREHDSIFEEQVADELRKRGYDIHAQVGLAGFFIDLAVADFERPGRFVLGIECDGAPYHSSRSARDRDRLRQAVLEDHGWIIHRIWSTDWFQRPQEQLNRTLLAIEAAKAALADKDEKLETFDRPVPVKVVTIEEEQETFVGFEAIPPATLSTPYIEASFSVPRQVELHDVNASVMAEIVKQVVEIEGPVHVAEVTARIRTLWGLLRAGNRIQAAVERGIDSAVRRGYVIRHGSFLSALDASIEVRDRGEASPGLRKPEALPPAEIRLAARKFVQAYFGASPDEAIQGVSRLFGFKSTSVQIRDIIAAEIDAAVRDGALTMQGDLLVAP